MKKCHHFNVVNIWYRLSLHVLFIYTSSLFSLVLLIFKDVVIRNSCDHKFSRKVGLSVAQCMLIKIYQKEHSFCYSIQVFNQSTLIENWPLDNAHLCSSSNYEVYSSLRKTLTIYWTEKKIEWVCTHDIFELLSIRIYLYNVCKLFFIRCCCTEVFNMDVFHSRSTKDFINSQRQRLNCIFTWRQCQSSF